MNTCVSWQLKRSGYCHDSTFVHLPDRKKLFIKLPSLSPNVKIRCNYQSGNRRLGQGVKSLSLTFNCFSRCGIKSVKDIDLPHYFARYASSNLSILGPQRSPLQSPLPDPRSLFISCSEVAPFFIASMKRFRGIPLQIQIVSFCSNQSLLRSSGSMRSVFLLPCFFEVRDKKCQG